MGTVFRLYGGCIKKTKYKQMIYLILEVWDAMLSSFKLLHTSLQPSGASGIFVPQDSVIYLEVLSLSSPIKLYRSLNVSYIEM